MTRRPASRPVACTICDAPLPPAATGRPRVTCSDRCRQARRRRRLDPGGSDKAWRAADRELRRIEKRTGSLAIPRGAYLTLRDRLRIRLVRGEKIPFCQWCGMPYVQDTYRKHPVCSEKCRRKYLKHGQTVLDAMCYWRKLYDRTLEARLVTGEVIPLCAHCGKPFNSSNPQRKYCSDRCRKAAWWQRNPHWRCTECGNPCPGRRRQCSPNCAMHYHRRTGQFCARCHHAVPRGSEFLPDADTRLPNRAKTPVIFCSPRCRDTLGWLPIHKSCDECGQPYYPSVPNHQRWRRFCSAPCRDRFYSRKGVAQRDAAHGPHTCAHCGDPFTVSNSHARHQRFCSVKCRRQAQVLRDRARRQQPIPIPAHVFIHEYAYAGDK